MLRTDSLRASQISQPLAAGVGSVVTLTPAASGGTAYVQYTQASLTDVQNGQATWLTWPNRSVSATSSDVAAFPCFVRAWVTSGAMTLTVADADPTQFPQSTLIPWKSLAPAFSTDASGNITGMAVGSYTASLRPGNTVILFGCSITDNNYDSTGGTPIVWQSWGYWTWANMLLGQRFNVLNESGVGGNTTTLGLARFARDVLAYQPKYWVAECGIVNDIFNSVAPATTIANLTSMYAQAFAAGIITIAPTCTPATFNTAQIAAWQQINAFIIDYCAKNPGMILVDVAAALESSTDGAPGATWTSDGIHPVILGAQLMGRAYYEVLDPIIPKAFPVNSTQSKASPTKNVYLNGNGWGSNASGANGFTLGTGCTGVGPDNWGLSRTGTTTIVGSKVAASDWRAAGWFRAAVTTGSANDQALVFPQDAIFDPWTSGGGITLNRIYKPTVYNGCNYRCISGGSFASGVDPTATWSTTLGVTFTPAGGSGTLQVVDSCDPGDVMFAQCEINMSSWSGAVLPVLQIWQYTNGYGSVVKKAIGNNWDGSMTLPTYVPGTPMVIRTPNFTIDPTMRIMHAQMGVYAGASVTGNLDVRNFEIRKAYLPTTFSPVA